MEFYNNIIIHSLSYAFSIYFCTIFFDTFARTYMHAHRHAEPARHTHTGAGNGSEGTSVSVYRRKIKRTVACGPRNCYAKSQFDFRPALWALFRLFSWTGSGLIQRKYSTFSAQRQHTLHKQHANIYRQTAIKQGCHAVGETNGSEALFTIFFSVECLLYLRFLWFIFT